MTNFNLKRSISIYHPPQIPHPPPELMATIKITQESPEKLVFTVSYIDVHIANAIRRALEGDVETYAVNGDFDSIVIDNNATKFHNERIKKKLHQLPINNEIVGDTSVTFSIDKTYIQEKNSNSYSFIDTYPVFTNDIVSSDKKTYFHPDILIIGLRKGENIKISKFGIDKGIASCCPDAKKPNGPAFKSCCSVGYRIVEESVGKEKVVQMTVTPCSYYKGIAYPRTPKKTLEMSIDSLISRFNGVIAKFEKKEVEIAQVGELSIIKIKDEWHTMANVLQKEILYLFENRKSKASTKLLTSSTTSTTSTTTSTSSTSTPNETSVLDQPLYCGYKIEHPLIPIVIFKITDKHAEEMMITALNHIVGLLTGIKKQLK